MRLLEDSAVTIWVKHQLEKEAKSQAQYIAALRLEREKAKAEQAALAAQPGYRVSTLSPLRAPLPILRHHTSSLPARNNLTPTPRPIPLSPPRLLPSHSLFTQSSIVAISCTATYVRIVGHRCGWPFR